MELVIKHEVGLHARPAALFVQTAKRFQSDIKVTVGDKTVDGKSILSVLTLGANQGASIRLSVDGVDEDKAIKTLTLLVENNFEEIGEKENR